jgi:hypothetical protein
LSAVSRTLPLDQVAALKDRIVAAIQRRQFRRRGDAHHRAARSMTTVLGASW